MSQCNFSSNGPGRFLGWKASGIRREYMPLSG